MTEDCLKQSAQLGNHDRPQIAILDFGSQYSHLIARRVRELQVYCELYSCLVPLAELSSKNVIGVILSGGPSSVYDEGSPHVSVDVWEWIETKNLPVMGICYGMQEIAHTNGGKVSPSEEREYGHSSMTIKRPSCPLIQGLDVEGEVMWMSHGDKITTLPEGFHGVASTGNSPHVIIEHEAKHMFGLQFHPEVTHSPKGTIILKNFVVGICQAEQNWEMSNFADEFIREVREKVGENGRVIGAVSGGVDSTVAAVLMAKAIGNRFHAVLVDNGLLRSDEASEVLKRLNAHGVDLRCVDVSDQFLSLLEGVKDPEKKRKIIGQTFIHVFQKEAEKLEKCDFLLQGTLYPDVIESISYKGPSATIKTHHNVGGLPANMRLSLIEPLRELFKDEVRELGMALGVPRESVFRHPFPGPGLAIRILGEVTKDRVKILQQADKIMIEELHAHNIYDAIGQAFVVLLPCKSVGVMGDGRTYENVAAIRCVETTDYMTADFYRMDFNILAKMSSRIINEVRGINRVCYDISSKPPATIEWE